jgi:hypothetical protein
LWRGGYQAMSIPMMNAFNKFFRNPHLKGQYGSSRKQKKRNA